MKENENNKRDLDLKNKETVRLKEKINNLNYRLGRMNNKLDSLKHEKSKDEFDLRIYKKDDQNETDPLNFISINIPKSLEFRVNSLKIEYSSKFFFFLSRNV